MKTPFKIITYLFLASTLLGFGYQFTKHTRDVVRIHNLRTIDRTIQLYLAKKDYLPSESSEANLLQILQKTGFLEKEIRDPVFTSSTIMMDKYAKFLVDTAEKVSSMMDEDTKTKIQEIKEASESAISPDFVIAYQKEKNDYEFSVKLESLYFKSKMAEDGGNDDNRYETGNNLKFDTSLKIVNEEVLANSPNTVIIR
ncbi:MAG TPA: hypothetical protein PLQ36_03590 [Candidatus Gracilibacteria bacterium]|nr:hypothetical protein [Candidatus Gracilibacteria bacterium]